MKGLSEYCEKQWDNNRTVFMITALVRPEGYPGEIIHK